MFQLVSAHWVTMTELKEIITLDEFLKLYAMYRMSKDIEAIEADKMKEGAEQ
jgi:phosphodiesterase/alkaline phosphatase D-like protein